MTPGARQERLTVDAQGTVRLAVTARATEGQANRAVCRAVAAWLGVPPSAVSIRFGASSRQKLLDIAGLSQDEIAARVAALRTSR